MPTLVLFTVSAFKVVVATMGVGVGLGVGVGVGVGFGVGVGVGLGLGVGIGVGVGVEVVDPLLVVVVAGVVKFDPAPPQPVMMANESKVQKEMPSCEIRFKSRLPKKGESSGFSYFTHSEGRSKRVTNILVEKN
ncbi:MAG: hypothetical protein ACJ71Q_11020 [Terriglobales bacterium]